MGGSDLIFNTASVAQCETFAIMFLVAQQGTRNDKKLETQGTATLL
ncbi:Uncharacterised protein [Yersinia thracica]|uniref:Uncharacterized protein n=1 Tax=Yersinia thracica TaxID=2890319 RepID=A0A0T9NC52_9GAMM|nr:Uncharacterised protein [Yersinia thracica]